jgi:predicted acetyltransferase
LIGTNGRKFYVIIEGSAYVLIKKKGLNKDSATEQGSEQKEASHKEHHVKKSIEQGVKEFQKYLKTPVDNENARLNMAYQCFPNQSIVRCLEQGSSFGDIALMHNSSGYV